MKKSLFIISFFTYSGYYAVLAILFSLHLANFSRYFSIPLRLVLSILLVAVIKKYINNFRIKNDIEKLSLLFFLVFWLFYFTKVLFTESMVSSNELTRPWYEYIFYSITYVILPFLAFYVIDFEKYKNTILNAFLTSGFVLGVFCLVIYGKTLGSGVGRISNLTYETGEAILSPLALSYAGSITIVLSIFKLLVYKNLKKNEKIFLISNIILAFIMFLLGSSRGSVIALILSALVFIGYSPVKQKMQFIIASIIATPLIIWGIVASGSGILARLSKTSEDGGGGRSYIWKNTFNHFTENPIFGGKIEIGGGYPHNFILEILMATGIVGALLIFPVIIMGFVKSKKIKKEDLFIFQIFIQGISLQLFTGAIWSSILIFLPLGLIIGYPGIKTK